MLWAILQQTPGPNIILGRDVKENGKITGTPFY